MAKKPSDKKVRADSRGPRAAILPNVLAEVLRRCKRHCCMCWGLHNVDKVTDGQIAHLDRDRTNAAIENLVYLCLECHKVYDTKNNRVQSFTGGELSYYRDLLYRRLGIDSIEWTITVRTNRDQYQSIKTIVEKVHSSLVQTCPEVTLTESRMM